MKQWRFLKKTGAKTRLKRDEAQATVIRWPGLDLSLRRVSVSPAAHQAPVRSSLGQQHPLFRRIADPP
jgi:hypothetical protein